MEAGGKLQGSERRARLHEMWSAVAGGWAEHAAFVDGRGAGVTERLLDSTMPRAGERVLEFGCGPGGLGIAAAAHVGDSGEVVLSDVAPAMVAIAAARVDALGLRNVSTRVLDLEEIDEPDASYDVVVCREAIMLVGDPARAAREIRRVLAPRRAGRADGLGSSRAQSVAWRRLRLGQRRARHADAAARRARAVLAR